MKAKTHFNQLRCIPLLILMALVIYVLGEEAGIAKPIGHEVNPSLEIKTSTTVITETTYIISLLNDPDGKELKIWEGAMKKSYLDSLEYIGRSELVFEGKLTDKFINDVFSDLAKKVGANVIIIDHHDSRRKVVTKDTILGIGGF